MARGPSECQFQWPGANRHKCVGKKGPRQGHPSGNNLASTRIVGSPWTRPDSRTTTPREGAGTRKAHSPRCELRPFLRAPCSCRDPPKHVRDRRRFPFAAPRRGNATSAESCGDLAKRLWLDFVTPPTKVREGVGWLAWESTPTKPTNATTTRATTGAKRPPTGDRFARALRRLVRRPAFPWPRGASTAEHQHIWGLLKSCHEGRTVQLGR
jgi:hypothetical protein